MVNSESRERRALSAASARWQSARCAATWSMAALIALGMAPGMSVTGAQASQVKTLPLGAYYCELPGDALHAAGVRVPAQDFAIVHSSTYASGGRMGSYLLTSDMIQMTSGPRAGEKFHRISDNFLRKVNADGSDSELRCIRMVTNNRE